MEAALLTALLSPDPARRPAIDDILRSGMLRQLHTGLTSPPQAPAALSSASAAPGAEAPACSPAAATAAPALGGKAAAAAAAAPALRGKAAAAQPPALPQPAATQSHLQILQPAQPSQQIDRRADAELAPAASLGGNHALQVETQLLSH